MKLVIQRVNSASVKVNSEIIGQINKGLLIYLGISKQYTEDKLNWMINKIQNLRLWQSEKKGFDLNLKQIEGEILIISQFTLYGDCNSSNKPNFNNAMEYERAEEIYNKFVCKLNQTGIKTETGKFGEMMEIESVNDGPVTIILEK